MSFSGLKYIFDGQLSSNYGLYIASINGNSVTNASAGSNIEIFSDSVYRNPTRYQYGASQSEILTFKLEVVSENPITASTRSKIQKWMFGRTHLCKLQIIQYDLDNIFFNCYLTNPETTYIDGACYGYTFDVECDSPWAWQLPKTHQYTEIATVFRHYNDSDDTDYTHPVIEFKMNPIIIGSGDIKITNLSDQNRSTVFTGMHPNEIVTINNRLQTIQSSEKRLLSEYFNKVFFRLLAGNNQLKCEGELEYFKITYPNARKVGG